MIRVRPVLFAASLIALAAPRTHAEAKIALALKAKPGQIMRYSSAINLTLTEQGTTLHVTEKDTDRKKVTAVSPSGDVTETVKSEDVTLSINGNESPAPPSEDESEDTIVSHPDGTLVSFKPGTGKDEGHVDERIHQATHIYFEKTAVGVGDQWAYDYPADTDTGTPTAHATYHITGEETVADADSFKVDMTYSETSGDHPIHAKGTLWIEKSSGDILKSDLTLDNVPFGPPGSPLATATATELRTEGSPLGDAKTGGVASAGAAAEPKTIADETKDFEKLPGYFTLYRKKGDDGVKLYMEINEDQLDKMLLMEVTARTGDASQVVAGNPINDLAFKFVKTPDGKITIVVPNYNFRATPGTPWERAVKRSFADAELESFDIKAEDKKANSYLIDVSGLFKGNIAQITDLFSNPLAGLFGGGGGGAYALDSEKTYLLDIKNFPKDMVIETHYNFNKVGQGGGGGLAALFGGGGSTLADDRSIPFIAEYTLFPLPEDNGYRPRIADTRIGFFQVEYTDVESPKADQSVHYIYRWNIQKADPKAALSPPQKPIVMWLDNAIPMEYRAPLREGLLFWNRAFEKIGIENAIVVKQMPDDAKWDQGDMRYNVVRWVASPDSGYAVSLMRVNPLTGQILNADITVDANLIRLTKVMQEFSVKPITGYFDSLWKPLSPLQTAQRSLSAAECDLDAQSSANAGLGDMALDMLKGTQNTNAHSYMYEFVRATIAHEMGHILGLRHNFIASAYHTLAELKNPAIVRSTGITASVMDYLPFNISALHQKDDPFYTPRIGPYDEWAIKYGYMAVPGATTPQGELFALHQVASQSNLPGHPYESDGQADSFAPKVTRFDLGADPLDYWHKMLDLTRYLLMTLPKRAPEQDRSYWQFTRDFNFLLGQHIKAASEVARYIGGLNMNRNFKGDPGEKPNLVPVSKEKQVEALDILDSYILAAGALHFPESYYTHFISNPNASLSFQPSEYPIFDTISSAQESALHALFSASVLTRVVNNEYKVGDKKTLPLDTLFHKLTATVWSELFDGSSIGPLHRQLQRTYVDIMTDMVDNTSSSAPADAKMLAWNSMKNLSSEIGTALQKPHDDMTHIQLEDMKMRIDRALNAQRVMGAPGGGGSSSLLQALLGGEKPQQ